jgi:hypothetical protein
MPDHYYLREIEDVHNDLIRVLTLDVLNYYHSPGINSKKEWLKKEAFIRNYRSAQGERLKSLPMSYEIVSQKLLTNRFFLPQEFNLFPMECIWLDHSLAVAKLISQPNQPFIELGTDHIYGTTNPVTIRLNQPGIAATSLMNHLFRHVIASRALLINESNKILSLKWYLDLRNVICDAVSLVDMTLNRLHYEAENNPKSNWTVAANLGERHGGRLLDKIEWVHKCTGETIPDIGNEKKALIRLKDFRNQFMHFDPPYFVHEFSELVILLNDILALGALIYKIRKTIKAEISTALIAFLMQKKVEFVSKKEVTVAISL